MTDQTNPPALSPNSFTRRHIIAASAIGVCTPAIAAAQDAAPESTKSKAVIITRAIHQEEDFNAPPRRIYEALLDSKQFTAFSGGRVAEIQPEAGGVFSLFAGHIVGRNLELTPHRRIVQAWRVVPWQDGIYSIARLSWLHRVPAPESSLTTPAFRRNWPSIWQAAGPKTIGRLCEGNELLDSPRR